MINVNELRIGNLVVTDIGSTVPIRGGGINAIEQGQLKVYPIPLTPEILEKCGFEKMEPITWHGNGYDYTLSAEQGGTTTTQQDYVIFNAYRDQDFIVRFETYKYLEHDNINYVVDKCISFHLCEWHPKNSNKLECFNPEYLHMLQNCIYFATGEELTINL